MIAFVHGILQDITDEALVIDIGGVGLNLLTPLHMLEKRPVVGEEITLYTSLQVREDSWQLFGFTDKQQLEIFRALISVSGVGCKTALAILDTINTQQIINAIVGGDFNCFCAVSGVGKKTAQRLIIDLKEKFAKYGVQDNSGEFVSLSQPSKADNDLLAALQQLGYSATEARHLALTVQKNAATDANTQSLLTEALKLAAQK